MNYTSPNEEQTKSIGRQLAAMVKGGNIVLLKGDLGAGKTTFTKGFAEGLGISEVITSPTFSLMNVYPVEEHNSIKQLVHIDTYRLEQKDDLLAIGVEDYLGAANTVCIIEWPEKIPTLLKQHTPISVSISHEGDHARTILIEDIS